MAELGRLLTAMVTPFTEKGDVDYPRARELAKAILKSGSEGLVIGGTTGEAPAMSDEELLERARELSDRFANLEAGNMDGRQPSV